MLPRIEGGSRRRKGIPASTKKQFLDALHNKSNETVHLPDSMVSTIESGTRNLNHGKVDRSKTKTKTKTKRKRKMKMKMRKKMRQIDGRKAGRKAEYDKHKHKPRWTPSEDRASALSAQRQAEMNQANEAADMMLIERKMARRLPYEKHRLSTINPAVEQHTAAHNHNYAIDPPLKSAAPISTPPWQMRQFRVIERYKQERLPGRRVPTPVFRSLPESCFPEFPPEGKYCIISIQTAFRRYAQRGTLPRLRFIAEQNRLYYDHACFLQRWARKRMQGWDKSWAAEHRRVLLRAIVEKLAPEVALDCVVIVISHAKDFIAEIAERVHAKSLLACTLIPWWRRLKQMWEDQALLQRMLLESRASKKIQKCWKDSRMRMKIKEAYKLDCATIIIQSLARGHFGRKIAEQLRRNIAPVKFQRRWHYYWSRCRAAQRRKKFVSSTHVTELREAESRLSSGVLLAEDAFYRLLWAGTNCVTRDRNQATFARLCKNKFKEPKPIRKRKRYSPRTRVISRPGSQQDVVWSDVEQSDTESSPSDDATSGGEKEQSIEQAVAPTDEGRDELHQCEGNVTVYHRKCRVQPDREIRRFFQITISETRNKDTLTMLRMCKAIYLFSLGNIPNILEGQEIMAQVRKDDKHFSCWNGNKKRLEFLERYWTTVPGLLGANIGFDPVHIELLKAVWNWHCFRRFDIAEAAFEKAVSIAKPDQLPDLRKAFQCIHHDYEERSKSTWKRPARIMAEPPIETLVVKRLFRNYRMFLGIGSERSRIKEIGLVSHKLLLETRARVSKKLMRIKVFIEGTHNFLFDAAGIKRLKPKDSPHTDKTGINTPKKRKNNKKKKKKKKKKDKDEVLTGQRWTTIVTGEEARNLFVNLGRAADLKDPEKVARGVIDMFVLRKLEKGFQQIGSGEDETILAIRVSSGLEVRHKVIHHSTKQGYQISVNFFLSEDRAMSIQAVRTLQSGQQVDYGVHLTLKDVIRQFRDYDYELKNYRYHTMWRVRAVELIRKMLHHFEIMKKSVGDPERTNTYSENTSARILTYVDGKEKEEQDYVASFLPSLNEDNRAEIEEVTRLGIFNSRKRMVDAAKGYTAIRCQSWWQGLKGRRRVLLIRKTNAANVLLRYVRPWYLERMGRITLVQKTVRGHLQRCQTMFLLMPLNRELRDLRDMEIRLGITYKEYNQAWVNFSRARIFMSARHRQSHFSGFHRRIPNHIHCR